MPHDEPPIKDQSLAAGQELMRTRITRIIEGYELRAEKSGAKEVHRILMRILGEIDKLELV